MEDIYELLNNAEMHLEEFENQKLSDYESKIAKKQILKEVRRMKNSKKLWRKTFVAAAACVCLMIGMGTISVAAGWLPIPDSIKEIFGINTDEELAVANTMGTSTDVVAEDNGYKISAEGIIGDGKNMGIVFKVEKSDGSTLLDNGKVPTDVEFRGIGSEDYTLGAVTGNVDSNNSANCMEYYIAFTYMDSVEDNVSISLEDMQLWVGDKKTDVLGKWEFDISFEIPDSSVNLAAGQKFKYGNSEGTIDEFMISPIGFSVRVTTRDKLSDSDFLDMPMEIHLKNGEVVELDGRCGPEDNDDGTWSWREDGVYENMILLDNVEVVVIGDTEFTLK